MDEHIPKEDRTSKEIHAMRLMAWERAKGELRALEHTYGGTEKLEEKKFYAFRKLLEGFIFEVEEHGLQE